MTVEAEPVAGIGSPAVATPVYTPAVGGGASNGASSGDFSVGESSFGGSNLDDLTFGDFSVGGIGSPMMGAEIVGSDLANTMLGGPELGGSYTGGMGNANPTTEAERQQSILDVNPYVVPTEGMSLEPVKKGDQTGYYFANELGLPARYGDVGSPQPADPATYDPNAKYIAPMPGFVPVDPNATYRLVNGGTDGSVVYSGAGEEGLRNVFQQANQLTMDNPKNAYWGVEVLNPATGNYDRVAENQGPNGLGIVGDIAGVALPIAAAIATGGASLGVQIAAGAAAGGLGGFLAGKDILKSALIGGATAGIGKVSGFNEAVGGALSNAGDAIKNALLPEVAKQAATSVGGDIVVTGLGSLAKGLGAGAVQGIASGISNNLSDVTGYKTPAEKFAEQPQPENLQPPAPPPIDNTIVVSANKGISGSGSPFGAAVPVPVEAILNGTLAQPTPTQQPTTEEAATEEPKEEIVVNAYRPINPVGGFDPTSVSKDVAGIGDPVVAALPPLTNLPSDPALTQPEELPDDIVVNAPQSVLPPPPIPGFETVIPAITQGALNPTQTGPAPEKSTLDKVKDAFDIATTVLPIIGGIAGSGGGNSSPLVPKGGRYDVNPDRSDIFGARGLANIGFDPFTYGQASGDQPGEYMFFTRNPVTGALMANPAPITTPIANEPAGPAMYLPPSNLFAEGGEVDDDMAAHLMAYHKNGGHTGPGQVKGIGSGQEDKIPAWLSDGEYVWSAQDVADLGDGSTDEGVRRLDKMRHMVRRRAGRKDVKKIAKPQKGIDHMLKAVGGSK